MSKSCSSASYCAASTIGKKLNEKLKHHMARTAGTSNTDAVAARARQIMPK